MPLPSSPLSLPPPTKTIGALTLTASISDTPSRVIVTRTPQHYHHSHVTEEEINVRERRSGSFKLARFGRGRCGLEHKPEEPPSHRHHPQGDNNTTSITVSRLTTLRSSLPALRDATVEER